jgi:arylsulfatase A-like enzyme
MPNSSPFNLRICPFIAPFIVICALLPASFTAANPSENPPHILLIIADDLGWKDVGFHDSEIQTPNIDRIAHQGIELDRFYVQPTCSPTRAAIMTGKSPARLGLYRPIGKNQEIGLPLEEKILPEYLLDAGYTTAMFGKWHLGHHTPEYFPNQRGFEYFYGYVTGGIGYWDHNHGGGHDWQRNGKTLREEGYSTRLLATDAVRVISSHDATQPLFAYLALGAPHLPNEAPEQTIGKYSHLPNEKRRIHAAMIDEMDRAIGSVIAALEQKSMLDNTIVIFASDNGGLIYGSNEGPIRTVAKIATTIFDRPIPFTILEFMATNTFDGASDNSPLAGGKGDVREGGVRVPAAVLWPAQLKPGKHEGFITASDLLPTLLEIAHIGEPYPEKNLQLDGISHWQSLITATKIETPDYFVSGLLNDRAFYRWPWKLITGDEVQLYNVQVDPEEANNLAEQHPVRAAAMLDSANNWSKAPDSGASMFSVLFDIDTFGGEEDRQPWAEAAIDNSQER